jgi:hypothetical protein
MTTNDDPPAAPKNSVATGCLLFAGIMFAGWLFIMWPSSQGEREAAPRSKCKSNLKTIGIALHAYHDAHDCF